MKNERLVCLDVLRGLDMMYLVVSATFLPSLLRACRLRPETVAFVTSHPWEGFALFDIIMPLFIFMCGAAIPFALGRRLTPEGRPGKGYWRHVLSRFGLLWVLGCVAQGRLLALDPMTFSPFNNTLQTIAVGYLITAAVLCVRRAWIRPLVTAALVIGYAVFMACGADYGRGTNAANVLENRILTWLCPAGSAAFKTYEYSWFATIPMFGFMSLCGFHSTNIIRSAKAPWTKAGLLAGFGVGLLALGFVWQALGVPLVKHVFTVSFTLQAMGYCVLLLALLYVLTDILGFRRGLALPILFGQTSLAAYFIGDIFAAIPKKAAELFASGLADKFAEPWRPVITGLAAFALVAYALSVWRTYKRGKIPSTTNSPAQ